MSFFFFFIAPGAGVPNEKSHTVPRITGIFLSFSLTCCLKKFAAVFCWLSLGPPPPPRGARGQSKPGRKRASRIKGRAAFVAPTSGLRRARVLHPTSPKHHPDFAFVVKSAHFLSSSRGFELKGLRGGGPLSKHRLCQHVRMTKRL